LASIDFLRQLGVGGREGAKYFTKVELNELGFKSHYIFKEFPYSSYISDVMLQKIIEGLEMRVQSYIFLRKKGYPVPQTVRYCHNKNGNNLFMVMSDMTQGGKKRIWGWSDCMTPTQFEELSNMELSRYEVQHITELVQMLTNQANKDKISFQHWYYHVLQDVDSRKSAWK
jgi:hypothetical protein